MKSIKIEKKEKKIETKNGSNVDCQENVNGEDNRAKGIKWKVTDDEVRTEEVRERIRDRGRVSKRERERERA